MHNQEHGRASHRPGLRCLPSRTGRTDTVVLVLHGGKSRSHEAVRPHQAAYLRMVFLARELHRATSGSHAAVWLLRNRVRGWNEPELDAVRDAEWALRAVADTHPGAGVVLVGHSLGGRVALRLAGDDRVSGVCALAPWIDEDPVEQLVDTSVLIVHGSDDQTTSPDVSEQYADRAARGNPHVRFVRIPRAGHAMLRRSSQWHAVTRHWIRLLVADAGAEQ